MSISQRLEEARKAYKNKDVGASAQAHTPDRIKNAKEQHGAAGSEYMSNFIYGALDGIITTFAVVSGVAGARLDPGIVLIMGLANLFGDGFSMATGAYLSAKNDIEYYARERSREKWEVEHFPEGEKQELIEIYLQQGYPQDDVQKMVEIKTKDPERWLNAMMVEELNMLPENRKPVTSALITFAGFVVAGVLPLSYYLLDLVFHFNLTSSNAFLVAIGLSGLALFGIGAAKVTVTENNPWKSGLEMLIVGGLAAAVAYGIGALLKGLGL